MLIDGAKVELRALESGMVGLAQFTVEDLELIGDMFAFVLQQAKVLIVSFASFHALN